MANRDVALGISGVVVGVLLGAGSVHFTQEASLSASSVDEVAAVYFDLDESDGEKVSARNVQRREMEEQTKENARAQRKAARAKNQGEETHDSAPAQPSDACDIARNMTQRTWLAIDSIFPAEQEFQKFTDPLRIVLGNIEKDYCGTEATEDVGSATESAKRTAPQNVDNDCEQYEEGSRRRTICVGNEIEGLPYTGE